MLEKSGDKNENESGPGEMYSTFLFMDDLLEKLKLLNYDSNFLTLSNSYKPLSKSYFCRKTNAGEQFFIFTNLAAWLVQKTTNAKFQAPEEHDDPNAVISDILEEWRKLDINADLSPNKLKVGSGEQCINVLNSFADAALKNIQFQWENPIYPKAATNLIETDGATSVEAAAENEELQEIEMNEDLDDQYDDDDEDEADVLDLEGLQRSSKRNFESSLTERSVLRSQTNVNDWKNEVERVTPSLKIVVRPDAKDWRSRIEQIRIYRENVEHAFKQLQPSLIRTINEIEKNMEKIEFHEQYLNSELNGLLSQYRTAKDSLAEKREKYKEASSGIAVRAKELNSLTDEVDQTKQELEERSLSLTDGG
uniref:Intraflagellar transport protein 57 homolog n=1 Tax=Romanomermis culicivorax TaxID=13658 RepID=A0A915IR71_ROMCU